MASKPPSPIIGRAPCPECGFKAAHVKRSDKGTLYRFCPEFDCKAQYIPRGPKAEARLMDAMRPTEPSASASVKPVTEPSPVAVDPIAAIVDAGEPAAPPTRRGLFS